jgi:hypothetical protein
MAAAVGAFTRELTDWHAAHYADLLFVTSAICPQATAWIDRTSTVLAVVSRRPARGPATR